MQLWNVVVMVVVVSPSSLSADLIHNIIYKNPGPEQCFSSSSIISYQYLCKNTPGSIWLLCPQIQFNWILRTDPLLSRPVNRHRIAATDMTFRIDIKYILEQSRIHSSILINPRNQSDQSLSTCYLSLLHCTRTHPVRTLLAVQFYRPFLSLRLALSIHSLITRSS